MFDDINPNNRMSNATDDNPMPDVEVRTISLTTTSPELSKWGRELEKRVVDHPKPEEDKPYRLRVGQTYPTWSLHEKHKTTD